MIDLHYWPTPNGWKVAIALEEIAHIAFDTLMLSPQQAPLEQYLLDKHFQRKHGATAYYGQKNT